MLQSQHIGEKLTHQMFVEMFVHHKYYRNQDEWRLVFTSYSTMLTLNIITVRRRRSINLLLRAHATKLIYILPFLFEGCKQWLFRHD